MLVIIKSLQNTTVMMSEEERNITAAEAQNFPMDSEADRITNKKALGDPLEKQKPR